MIEKYVNLNLDLNAPPAILHVTQGDTAWEWHFRLFMDGSRWTIPTGAQIIFKGLKPDGHVFAFSGAVSSNEAVVTSDLQMTICAGEVPCSLLILDANAKRLAFGRITMYVAADAEGQFDVASESALPAYVELLEQYAQIIDEAASIPDDLPGYITDNVDAWLVAHPEATTTVQDGAITKAKLAAALVAELTPDATLSLAGKPADAKATGAAVDDLKSALITEETDLTSYASSGYYATNGEVGSTVDVSTKTESSSFYSVVVPVSQGDKFEIRGTGGSIPRLWCFTDESYKIVSSADAVVYGVFSLEAPSDGFLFFEFQIANAYYIRRVNHSKLKDTDTDVDNVKSTIADYQIIAPNAESFAIGVINPSTGAYASNATNRVSNLEFIDISFFTPEAYESVTFTVEDGYKCDLAFYSSASESSFVSGYSFFTGAKTINVLELDSSVKFFRYSIAMTNDAKLYGIISYSIFDKVHFAFNKLDGKELKQVELPYVEVGNLCDIKGYNRYKLIKKSPYTTLFKESRNLYAATTYYRNNYGGFDGITEPIMTTRIRTNSFYIPPKVKNITISGLPNNVVIMEIRGFDCNQNRILDGAFLKQIDDYYVAELADGVVYIHLMFKAADDSDIDATVFDGNHIMLEIGTVKHDYVARNHVAFSWPQAYTDQFTKISNTIDTNGDYYLIYSVAGSNTFAVEAFFGVDTNEKLTLNTPSRKHKYFKLASDYSVTDFDIDTTYDQYITKIQTLCTNSRKYATMKSIGKDASNTYTMQLITLDSNAYEANKPTICIICTQHGYEKVGSFSAYYLVDLLTNHFQESDVLQYLHDNYRLLIVPVANPYGFNQYVTATAGTETGYNNSSGVNLNRNWSVGYSGTGTPFSEAETKNIRDAFADCYNIKFFMDLHGNGTTRSHNDLKYFNWVLLCEDNADLEQTAREHLNMISPNMCFEWGINQNLVGYISVNEAMGTAKDYYNSFGIKSCIFELPHRLPNSASTEFTEDSMRSSVEMMVTWLGCVNDLLTE